MAVAATATGGLRVNRECVDKIPCPIVQTARRGDVAPPLEIVRRLPLSQELCKRDSRFHLRPCGSNHIGRSMDRYPGELSAPSRPRVVAVPMAGSFVEPGPPGRTSMGQDHVTVVTDHLLEFMDQNRRRTVPPVYRARRAGGLQYQPVENLGSIGVAPAPAGPRPRSSPPSRHPPGNCRSRG